MVIGAWEGSWKNDGDGGCSTSGGERKMSQCQHPAKTRGEFRSVRDGQAGLQGWNARQVLIEEKAPHATRSSEYWLPISRAA
jgi:hypothetical protein